MGFFEFANLIKTIEYDFNKSGLVCINGPRNIGKSTAVLNYLFDANNPRVDVNNKILVVRNNEPQLITAKQDFNARFNNQYKVVNNMIYSLITKVKKDGTITTKVGDHVGYFGAISTYTNLKSVEAKNIKYIFYDEYAQTDLFGIYDKFISLLKTFERFNVVLTVMLGNRESKNNEYMNAWGVIPNQTGYEDDYIVKFSDNCYFVELGSNQFKDLKNEDTLANKLAKFNENSANYLINNHYKNDNELSVKNFNDFQIINVYYGVCYQNVEFGFCKLKLKSENKKTLGIIKHNAIKQILKDNQFAIFNVDADSILDPNTDLIDKQKQVKIITFLINEFRNNNLYFDSFDGLIMIKELVKRACFFKTRYLN